MVEELTESIESGELVFSVPVASFSTEVSVAESSSSEEMFTEEDLVFDYFDGEEDGEDETIWDLDDDVAAVLEDLVASFPTWGIALIAVLAVLVASAVGVVMYLNKKMKL